MAGAIQPRSVVCSVADSAFGHAGVAGELADTLGLRLVLVRPGPSKLGGGRHRRVTETARHERAGFIVVPARGAAHGLLMGAVWNRILSATPCPLVVVPPGTAHFGRTALFGERVLCGVKDLGDIVTANVAVELARALDARLTLVHVLRTNGAARLLSPANSERAMARGDRPRRVARVLLQNVLDAVGPTPPGGYELWVLEGNVAKHLIGFTGDRQVACVVLGARGTSTLHVRPFGSVASRLTRRSLQPIVLCPLASCSGHELSRAVTAGEP